MPGCDLCPTAATWRLFVCLPCDVRGGRQWGWLAACAVHAADIGAGRALVKKGL